MSVAVPESVAMPVSVAVAMPVSVAVPVFVARDRAYAREPALCTCARHVTNASRARQTTKGDPRLFRQVHMALDAVQSSRSKHFGHLGCLIEPMLNQHRRASDRILACVACDSSIKFHTISTAIER